MRTLLRTLLLWLMLLAMPIQALAYAGMSGHAWQHRSNEVMAHVGADDGAGIAVAISMHHGHHGAAAHRVGHDAHSGSDRACECALCLSPVLPASLPALATPDLGSAAIAFIPPYFYGFTPPLLERPPYSRA